MRTPSPAMARALRRPVEREGLDNVPVVQGAWGEVPSRLTTRRVRGLVLFDQENGPSGGLRPGRDRVFHRGAWRLF
jgi:hypothetical protein